MKMISRTVTELIFHIVKRSTCINSFKKIICNKVDELDKR